MSVPMINTDTQSEKAVSLCKEWQSVLSRYAANILDITTNSEQEFLTLGGQFQALWGSAGEIANDSKLMLQKISGEEFSATSDTIRGIVGQLNEYLSHSRGDTREISSQFKEITTRIAEAKSPLLGFGKINKILRMLGISTKIESSRLGNSAAGFENLANDVTRLSVEVVGKSESIMFKLSQLEEAIVKTLDRVKAVEIHQDTEIQTSMAKVHNSLQTVEEVNAERVQATEILSSISSGMETKLAEIVTFMQFHDIVRQQLEHVKESFDSLYQGLEKIVRLTDAERADLVIETGDICELQVAQLKNSEYELNTALSTITSNLKTISDMVGTLAHEARKIAGSETDANNSYFVTLEDNLSVITALLSHSSDQNKALTDTIRSVIETISEIVSFIGDIEMIGEDIELIALNAQIKAAKTGPEGASLGVLAEAIQRLSTETLEQTAAVSTPLTRISGMTERLQSIVSESSNSVDQQINLMLENLDVTLKTMRAIHAEVETSAGNLEKCVQTLQMKLEEDISMMSSQKKYADAIHCAIDATQGLVEETRREVPPPPGRPAAERLKALAARYTMHSERKVHASIAGELHKAEAPSQYAPPAGPSEGLGDNVELF